MSPRITPAFHNAYKTLNHAQKQAVDTIEGPVMVVAGPGTGKTQILTLRIANILKETDTPPDAVLALTFTEAAAANMRRRLARIVGSAAYRVHIHTFHGFCNDVIQRFPEEFPRIIGGEPTTDIDKITLLRQLIKDSSWEHLKPFGNNFHYINDIRGAISELKREHILPEDLRKHVDEAQRIFDDISDLYNEKGAHVGKMKGKYQTEAKRLGRTRELLSVYEAYQKTMQETHRYDFEDMIVEVVSALEKNEDFCLRLQEEFLYILADEHQDANASQNRLLELLSSFHASPNIFVVGDEKQAIFRFQGASLENFTYFKRHFSDAVLVELTEGYRSGQKILDVAHEMIQRGEATEAPRIPLISRAGITNEVVAVHAFADPDAEMSWVASEVARLIGEGVEPSEIAILYRTNGEAERWLRALEDRGTAVSVESDQNVLGDPDIRKFILLLKALTRFGDDGVMAEIVHIPFLGISPLDAYKIIHYARKEKVFIADVMGNDDHLRRARVQDGEMVKNLYGILERFAKAEGSVPEIVSDLLRESGFLAAILRSPRAVELIEKSAGLLRDIESLASGNPSYDLRALTEHIALLDEYRIPIKKEIRAAPREGSVRLMTAHRSKGLEFEHVFIVNAADGVWGGRRSKTHFTLPSGGVQGGDEDERRLLYVALTRARVSVSLTYPQEKEGKPLLPTRFLEEIQEDLLERHVHGERVDHAESLARPRMAAKVQLPDQNFLRELFIEQGLSVTALNNYLACPWRYFYSNLIRIPLSPTGALLYGNAADAALKRYFEEYREKGVLDPERLVALFKEAATRQPLIDRELNEMMERGEGHLRAWHAQWKDIFVKESLSGYRIETPFAVDGEHLSEILLRGEIDKMEFLSDVSSSAVRVIDYKSGKPKTRNAIEGKTKTEDGGYFRQLGFYKLLLDLEGKYILEEAVLDFIQPDERGKLHREVYARSDLDTATLKSDVARVAQEIWELSFWDKRCGEKDCRWCSLRDLTET